MQTISLHDKVIFHDNNPYAEPLFVDKDSRILRFALRPGQAVREHMSPNSPVYIMVLKGTGLFSGGDGKEERHGPGTLMVMSAKEVHAIRTDGEELIFLAILHGVPETL